MEYSQNVKLVHYVAKRIHGRILASGVNVDYEDIFQDASEKWLECQEKFQSELGFQFSTYFTNAANFSIFRHYTNKKSRFNSSIQSFVIDSEEELEIDPEDHSETVEESMMMDETVSKIVDSLSPISASLVKILINPPLIVLENLSALQDKAEFARTMGVERRAFKELTLTSLFQIFKIDKEERYRITKEIKENFIEAGLCT